MGFGMASNIRKKMPSTAVLYIYDVYRPSCERFQEVMKEVGSIVITDSPREAAENAGAVVSIVPGANEVRKVYLDEASGVISSKADSNRLILECSTIDSQSSREVGEALLAAGRGYYVDAPVSVGTSVDKPNVNNSVSATNCVSQTRAVFQPQTKGHCHS